MKTWTIQRPGKRSKPSDLQTGFSGKGTALFCLISAVNSWELSSIETQCSFSLTWKNSRLQTCYIVIANGEGEPARCGLAHSWFPAALLSLLMVSFSADISTFVPIEESPKSRQLPCKRFGLRWQVMLGCFCSIVSPLHQDFIPPLHLFSSDVAMSSPCPLSKNKGWRPCSRSQNYGHKLFKNVLVAPVPCTWSQV